MKLADLNEDRTQFCDALADIYEHSPWVAERSWASRPFDTLHDLVVAMDAAMRAATKEEQMALIRAHPDLAGRLALAGDLTADSTSEQAAAGLDQCTPEDLVAFQGLNDRYKDRYGFPFIMAVKKSSRADILDAFRRRVENTAEAEFAEALDQIAAIARLRLEALLVQETH
jgi:2-oxo-4-hydroxy-4-carboxy-5-ureidoimidazoline decarboxylase